MFSRRPAARDSRPPARISTIVMLGVFYSFMAVPTVYLAVGAYTPCVTNFEGGCGMAKGLAAIISLLPAAAAFTLAFVLQMQMATRPSIAQKYPILTPVVGLLWLAPAAYVLFTLYALF